MTLRERIGDLSQPGELITIILGPTIRLAASAALTAATGAPGQTITNDCSARHQVLAASEENPKILTDLGMK